MEEINEKRKKAMDNLRIEYLEEYPDSGYQFDGLILIDHSAGLIRFANNIPEKYKNKIIEIYEKIK